MKEKATEIVNQCVKLWVESQNKCIKEHGYFYPTMLPQKVYDLKKEFETLTGKDWNSSYEKYLT